MTKNRLKQNHTFLENNKTIEYYRRLLVIILRQTIIQNQSMISNHIYESTLRDLATLEEDQMIVDTCIDNLLIHSRNSIIEKKLHYYQAISLT